MENSDKAQGDQTNASPPSGLSCGLMELIDWQTVLAAPRCAGGHEEVMRSIFGTGSEVIAWWSDNDYQGEVAIAHKLTDGRVAVMTDYYGSCSGCDCWEDATDENAKKQVLDLVNSAKVFTSLEKAQAWCAGINAAEKPHEYPFIAARNLWLHQTVTDGAVGPVGESGAPGWPGHDGPCGPSCAGSCPCPQPEPDFERMSICTEPEDLGFEGTPLPDMLASISEGLSQMLDDSANEGKPVRSVILEARECETDPGRAQIFAHLLR